MLTLKLKFAQILTFIKSNVDHKTKIYTNFDLKTKILTDFDHYQIKF